MPIPLREGVGTSSWRLREDSVKQQVFYRNVSKIHDLDQRPSGNGSILSRKVSLISVYKVMDAERSQRDREVLGEVAQVCGRKQ